MSRCSNAHTVRCDPMAPPCQVMAAAPSPPPPPVDKKMSYSKLFASMLIYAIK